MKHKPLAFVLLSLLPFFTLAQGTITGKMLDENSAEPLIFANVLIEGTTNGATTDLDGKYEITAPAGTYTIIASYVGYQDKRIEGVVVKNNEVTYLDIVLSDQALQLTEVVVTASVIERSENAILLLQKKSDKIQDGISSQEMSRYSLGSAASAMEKVTGATVTGGKYVYIRGLGDRYSLSQLNGLIIPSTDPYRNGAQLDLIPSNLLENIITAKTFTPDQPGTFTGGNVDIRTKSFPEQFSLTVSTSLGYNAQNNFIDNFLTHDGGNTDYWGYDDGSRARPELLSDPKVQGVLNTQTPLIARLNVQGRGEEVAILADQAIKAIDNNFVPERKSTTFDHSFGISFSNKFNFLGKPLGVILATSFQQNYQHLDRFQKANWQLRTLSSNVLDNLGDFEETLSTENPVVNGMAGVAYKFSPTQVISFNAIYNHSTDKASRFIFGERPDNIINPDFLEGRQLAFGERELINYQLGGEHVFEKLNEAKVEWKVSLAQSSLEEPNTRFFENQYNSDFDSYSIPASNIQRPFYFFRRLDDEQRDYKLDIELPFSQKKGNKFKFGTLITQKERDFTEFRYQIEEHIGYTDPFENPEQYLSEDNLGIRNVEGGRYFLGNYLVDRTLPENNYSGTEDVTAFYGMLTLAITERFKTIAGARYEKTDIFVESQDEDKAPGEIEEENILPSVSLIYSLTPDMNLRAAYTQTLARPNMREIAPFVAYDPLTKEFFFGNPQLDKTDIQNVDLRWEWFTKPGELFAISAYYKNFNNPITQRYRRAPQPEIEFINVDEAFLYGIELEIRKDLDFMSPSLKNFKFNTNFSLIKSEMDVKAVQGLEDLEPDSRPFEGQSPFILNVALLYINPDNGVDATLTLNTVGDRLSRVGQEGTPDQYELGRSQLDFTFIKKFNNLNVKLTAQNILNARYALSSEYFDTDYLFYRFRRGVTFSLGLSYTIR